jgi:hypothetical protein
MLLSTNYWCITAFQFVLLAGIVRTHGEIMKLVKLLFPFIVLVIAFAPAAAQDSEYPAPENVKFTDDAGSFKWDKPSGEIRSFTIDVDRSETTVFRNYRWDRAGKDAVSGQILYFDRSYNWRVRVRANYAAGDSVPRAGKWSEWAYSYAPAPSPAEGLATATPSASYRSSYYENRTVYEAESCADRRDFRRCRQTCLRADSANCWGATCGPWLVGVAAPPSCPTPAGAATATATVAPSGSVSCENKVVAGENGFSCAFTLHNSRVAYQAVGWSDHPDAEHRIFGYFESEEGTVSSSILPAECGKTFLGRAIAFDVELEYLATVDFSHTAICTLPTDTPTPTAPATDTPTATATDTPTATATSTPTPTPEPQDLPAPGNLRTISDTVIAWDTVTGAISHRVTVRRDGGEWKLHFANAPQFTFAPAGSTGTFEIQVWALGDGVNFEWEGERSSITVTLATDTPVPPTATPIPTDTPVPPPRDTDPPKTNTPRPTNTRKPPDPTTPPEPTVCNEVCSPSSGVWSVTEDRTVHDGPVCSVRTYERTLQQYTCTKCGAQTRQYNQIVSDWREIRRRGC